jgi:hypothetical protein
MTIGVVASKWRLDSRGGARGAVDALVTPDTENAGSCDSLAYGPMVKMEATDIGAARTGCRG